MQSLNLYERAIKGLECCAKYPNEFGDCMGGDCPYGPRIECHKELLQDALALLKAQEPRVMSMDELSEKTDVYFESLVYDTICPALSAGSYDDGTVGLMTLEDELFYMDEADYGV